MTVVSHSQRGGGKAKKGSGMRTWDDLIKSGEDARDTGRLDTAMSFFKRALLLTLEWSTPEGYEVALSKIRIGETSARLGQPGAAISELRPGIELLQKVRGPAAAELLQACQVLAESLAAEGLYSEAVPAFDELVRLEEVCFGPNHLTVSRTLQRQAECHLELREELRAESLLRRSISIQELTLGTGHPAMVRPRVHLAALLVRQERGEEAVAALPTDLSALDGSEDLTLVRSLRTLARASLRGGNLSDARHFYERIAEIQQRVFAPDHPCLAESLRDLGYLYLRLEEFRKAESPLRLALSHFGAAHGLLHPAVARLFHWLGLALTGQSRFDEALPVLRRALEVTGRIEGAESAAYAEVLQSLGNLHRAQGNQRWAERFLRGAFGTFQAAVGLAGKEAVLAVRDLARCLLEQGRADEARRLFQHATLQVSSRRGAHCPSLDLYARAYRKLGLVSAIARAA